MMRLNGADGCSTCTRGNGYISFLDILEVMHCIPLAPVDPRKHHEPRVKIVFESVVAALSASRVDTEHVRWTWLCNRVSPAGLGYGSERTRLDVGMQKDRL